MALRKPVSRCNNSSPRYTRENHYAILARMKVSQVFTYKISITLLIFPKCRGKVIAFPIANLAKIFEREGVIAIENLYCDTALSFKKSSASEKPFIL